MDFTDQAFWIAVLQIIAIDIVLGGDNAVVIALASRRLPDAQRKLAIFWGVFGAIALRVILIFFALYLLAIPFLKTIGALLLLWIGVKLLIPEKEEGHEIAASTSLAGAVKTIIVADAVMSLDNVIAIAGAAKGDLGLVIFGLVVSVPIIVWGSKLVLKLMDRFPIVITAGGALLGWIAGDMVVTDVALAPWFQANMPGAGYILPVAGALLVIIVGKVIASRRGTEVVPAVEIGVGPVSQTAAVGGAAIGGAATAAAPAGAGLFNRIAVAVDGSEPALKAIQYVIRMHESAHRPAEFHLVNVQRPVTGDVSTFVGKGSIEDYHRERSEEATQPAREMLDRAGVPYQTHTLVGTPAEAISEFATARACDHIIMGTRGRGAAATGLLGSAAQGVAAKGEVPVILVQ